MDDNTPLNIFDIQDMLRNVLAPAILKELHKEGVNVRPEMFEIYFRPSDTHARVQGGNPVRIIIGLVPGEINTNDYWQFVKQQIKLVVKAYRSVALVRSGLITDISKGLYRAVKERTGVDINDIPLTLKEHEYEIKEMCVIRVRHRKTGIEVQLGDNFSNSIKTRESAILLLSEAVHKAGMEDVELRWLQKLG